MLIYIATILIIIVIINLLYFILPSLSPIPFFPTNGRDLEMIINRILDFPISNFQSQISNVVVDLGAGTGTVIFAAAKKAYENESRAKMPILRSRLGDPSGEAREKYGIERKFVNTQFIAVEIHPLLLTIMHLRRLLHPNRQNIHILRADIFQLDFHKLISDFQISNFPSATLRAGKSQITIYLYVGPFVMERLKPQLLKLPKKTPIISYMYQIPGWENRLFKTQKGFHDLYCYRL